jgi:predicted dehydrogenase
MLATTPLDALYVCLPPFAHSGQTERAAERGIHLFLEKPIAADVAQAEAMVGAIERAGVISQVGYHLRFRRAIVRLKELIDGGQAGRPTLFEGRFWCNFGGPSWWADISKSGGQAFEQLIHLYDLALYLLGSPDQASGYLANLLHSADPAYTIEDTSAGLVRFRNGSLATITGSNCAVPNAFFSDFRAVFERATLDYRSTGDWRTHDQATLYRHNGSNVEREEVTEDGDVYADETAAFLATIRGDRPPIAPAREGLNGIRLVSAVLESAQQDGLPIKLEG